MGEDGGARSGGSRGRYPYLEAIARKCEPFGIETELEEDGTLWVAFPEDERLPDGSPEYLLEILAGQHALGALRAPFEQYRDFRDASRPYAAMWSRSLGVIECELVPCDRPPGASGYGREHDESVGRIFKALGYEADVFGNLDPFLRVLFETDGGAEASIGPSSDEWAVRRMRVYYAGDDEDVEIRRDLTLRIEGAELPDQGRAEDVLERLGNSALFELDRALSVGLRLRTRNPGGARPDRSARNLPARLVAEYDREPMSLYWYARSAEEGMPLLAFLAYYQVLEFYFPAYSPSALVAALREKLRDLAAREVGEDDVEGVLEAAGLTRKRLLPEERKQLMNVLGRCVDPEKLEEFLVGDGERARFYGSEESLAISRRGLPPAKDDGKRKDRRNRVAERIYDIRNRVVHAKSQHDDLDVLLPFDPEAELLWHDVELVAFLARETLSASAKPLGSKAAGTP